MKVRTILTNIGCVAVGLSVIWVVNALLPAPAWALWPEDWNLMTRTIVTGLMVASVYLLARVADLKNEVAALRREVHRQR